MKDGHFNHALSFFFFNPFFDPSESYQVPDFKQNQRIQTSFSSISRRRKNVTYNNLGKSLQWPLIRNHGLKIFSIGWRILANHLCFAFTLIGNSSVKGFRDPNITILINENSCPSDLSLRALLDSAISVWNGIPTSKLELTLGEETTSKTAGIPPVAYCDPTMTGSTLGQGGASFGSDGYARSGFLRINTNPASSGYVLDQSPEQQSIVVAHEIGHLLGLGHTDKAYALMNYSLGVKTDLSLSQDDIDGINYLYPRDELTGDSPFSGCGTLSSLTSRLPPDDTLTFFEEEHLPGLKLDTFLLVFSFAFPILIFGLLRQKSSLMNADSVHFLKNY